MSSDQTAEESWIIPRPPAQLMDLPVNLRWEVSRRHPYYLRFWHQARQLHRQPASDPQQRALEQTAVLLLQVIGVSGDPPSPAAGTQDLGTRSLSRGWQNGVVAPVTFRGLAGMLLADLPAEARLELGRFLTASVLQPSQADGDSSRILNVAGVSDNEIANRRIGKLPVRRHGKAVVGNQGEVPGSLTHALGDHLDAAVAESGQDDTGMPRGALVACSY